MKKKTFDVVFVGWYLLVTGVLGFIATGLKIKKEWEGWTEIPEMMPVIFIWFLALFIAAMGWNVLGQRELWRKITIYYHAIAVVANAAGAYALGLHLPSEYVMLVLVCLYYSFIIFVLTRPRVKAQFSNQGA